MYEPTKYDWQQYRKALKSLHANEHIPSPDEIREWKLRINRENGIDGPPPEAPMKLECLTHILHLGDDDE